MKKEDIRRIVDSGCSVQLVATTTNSGKIEHRHLYTFTPETMERFIRYSRNATLDEAALYVEFSGSKSRTWLAEGIRFFKEKDEY